MFLYSSVQCTDNGQFANVKCCSVFEITFGMRERDAVEHRIICNREERRCFLIWAT